jgi:hypothetical protein
MSRQTVIAATFTILGLATTVSTATAAECISKVGAQCLSVEAPLTETAKFTGTKRAETVSRLAIEGLGTLECSSMTDEGTFDETEAGVVSLGEVAKWTGCKLAGHASCKVAEPITTKAFSGTLTIKEGIGTATFKPEAGEEWATVIISGCEQEAIVKMAGTQKCSSPAVETEAVEHELVCLPSGSSLKFGAKHAEFTLTGLGLLASGKPTATRTNSF